MIGYIYLLECVSDSETTYKIGFTKNKDIKKRISNLQTGNKDKIKCINFFKTVHGRVVEISLHNLYSHKRKGGEWFELEINDVVNFLPACEMIEKNISILESFNNPFIKK